MRLISHMLLAITALLASITAHSQNLIDVTDDILIVYQREGVTTHLLKSDVDSMKLSNIDVDSVVHTNYVVQEIITPDSIYRIALAEIDSISLKPAPTKLKPGVINLEDNKGYLRTYVLRCELDNSHIYFSNWLQESKLPPVGSILYAEENAKYNLPYGFYGKVKSITNTGSKYDVECEDIPLDDVYETYCRAFIYDAGQDHTYYPPETLMPDDESTTYASLKSPGISEDYIGAPINFPKRTFDFNEETLKAGIELGDFSLMGEPVNKTLEELKKEHEEDYKSEKEKGLYGSVSNQVSVAMKIFATKLKLGEPFYVSGLTEITFNSTINIGFQGKITKKARKRKCIWQPPKPIFIRLGNGFFIEVSADLSLIGRFEGEGGMKFGASSQDKVIASFSLCRPGTSPKKSEMHFKHASHTVDFCTLYGKASVEGGLRVSLNIAPLTKYIVHASVFGEIGIRGVASVSMNAIDILDAETSPGLYRNMTDDNALKVEGYTKIGVAAGALFDTFLTDLDFGHEWTKTFWNSSLMSNMTKLERHNLQHIRYHFESEPFLDRVIRGASTRNYSWRLNPFFSIKDVTPGTKFPHDYTIKELKEDNTHPYYWAFTSLDNGADITINSYYLNPLHMYEVTPYAMLTKTTYSTDLNEEPKYEYYPIMIDEAKRFDLRYVKDMSASYSYLFRQNSTNRHMLNIQVPTPDLKKIEGVKEWGVFFAPAIEEVPGCDIIKNENGWNYYNYDAIKTSANSFAFAPDEYVGDIDYAGIPAESQILDREVEFQLPFYAGYYAKYEDEDGFERNVLLSVKYLNPTKRYSYDDTPTCSGWTANWAPDNNGISQIKSYTGTIRHRLTNSLLWSDTYDISGARFSLSQEVLSFNPFIKSSDILYQNSPSEYKRELRLSPGSTHTISNSVQSTRGNKHMKWEFTPPSTAPVLKK